MYGLQEQRKVLIVVYKDEMLLNQFKKLVETNDDQKIPGSDGNPVIVGTVDDSINVVSWREEVWLDNKRNGNIKGKVLFLGDIQGTKDLIPVIDIKFDKYGIRYGWAGDQAVLHANVSVLGKREDYEVFLSELERMPVPDMLKTLVRKEKPQEKVEAEKKASRNIFESAVGVLAGGINAIGKAGGDLIQWVGDVFRDKALVERQMLFYGVIRMYEDHLQAFMDE